MRSSDTNCIQIMMLPVLNDAPGEVPPPCAERLGNVAREEAAVLAEFMGNNLSDSLDDTTYDIDYIAVREVTVYRHDNQIVCKYVTRTVTVSF